MKTQFALISFIVLIVAFSSCSKSALEDKIVGEWQKISVGQISEGTEVTWTFNADRTMYRTITSGTSVLVDSAQWSVENKIASKNTLSIENLHSNIDGKHLIHQLDDYLELQRVEFFNGHSDGSFQWNEFQKK